MKKTITHKPKAKRYKVKRYKQRHKIVRPKRKPWHTDRFIHGPRLKQPGDFKNIFTADQKFMKKRHLDIPKTAFPRIRKYAEQENLSLPQGWKNKVKAKVGDTKKGEFVIQSFLTPIKKNRSSYEDEMDDDWEFEREQMKQDERRRKYGLPESWQDSDVSSRIVKEDKKKGIALIHHHDPYSPASESPDIWEIRKGDEILWNSGITYMAEYLFSGVGKEEVALSDRKHAEKEFERIVKKQK
jgi:hypothetical protein